MKGKKGKKSATPPPKKPEEEVIENQQEPPPVVVIDSQKLVKSDSAILNPNQLLGTLEGADTIFIPDDASSVVEEELPHPASLGILTEDVIASSLSNIGTSASGTQLVFLNLGLTGYDLKDLTALNSYVHLQKVDLSYNKLTDLSALSSMKFLVELDASHNQLKALFDFTPPIALREANFSHNSIQEMGDLSSYTHLIKLHVDHNNISKIEGLLSCRSLMVLTLSNNKIEKIEGLDNLRLRHLSLSCNLLGQIENLESVVLLQDVDLSGNNIFGLSGFSSKHRLYSLNMADNHVSDMEEIQHLVPIKSLRILNFLNNPIVQAEDYRKSVIFSMQHLKELDQQAISAEEKVVAINLFDPPPEVQAALDHITHTVYRFLQPSKIYESTLPSIEMPYPMLVLTGPQASGKRELAHRLAQEFPDYFGLGVSHTTRVPYPAEQDGRDYHFVTPDQFQSLVRQGCFVQTFKHSGCLYGLTLDAVESVAKEGLACVVHMEINGIRTLKNTYFEPRYVLIIPTSAEVHRAKMVERGVYSTQQIDHVIDNQTAIYRQVNQDHPGFFDMVINNNKLAEAYDRLRQLVMDYLGTSDLTSGETAATAEEMPRLSTTENKDETSTHHTTASATMRRTWSRPSYHGESSTSNDLGSSQNRLKLDSRKTPVEEASYKRRLDAAKEAIEGYSPSAYDEIFRRPMVPMTAPGLLEGSPMAQATSMCQDPSFAPVVYPNINNQRTEERLVQQVKGVSNGSKSSTPDSSNTSGRQSTSFSGLSSARRFSDDESVRVDKPNQFSKIVPPLEVAPLDLAALNDALESLKSKRDSSRSSTPLVPRRTQEIDDWLGGEDANKTQLGMNVKPVLPPIPTGGR